MIVAGKIRKSKGKLLDVDLRRLRGELEPSRDFIFRAERVLRPLTPSPAISASR